MGLSAARDSPSGQPRKHPGRTEPSMWESPGPGPGGVNPVFGYVRTRSGAGLVPDGAESTRISSCRAHGPRLIGDVTGWAAGRPAPPAGSRRAFPCGQPARGMIRGKDAGGVDPPSDREERSMVHAIQADGLSKRYGATLALDRLDLSVSPGEVYGFLGPNGAGKTTAIRLLLGLHRPTAGRAEVFGMDAWRDAVAVHRRVAYVAGEPFLWPDLTAAETLEFSAHPRRGRPCLSRRPRRSLPPRCRQVGARAVQGQPAEGPTDTTTQQNGDGKRPWAHHSPGSSRTDERW